jgi:hypothetical protein
VEDGLGEGGEFSREWTFDWGLGEHVGGKGDEAGGGGICTWCLFEVITLRVREGMEVRGGRGIPELLKR